MPKKGEKLDSKMLFGLMMFFMLLILLFMSKENQVKRY